MENKEGKKRKTRGKAEEWRVKGKGKEKMEEGRKGKDGKR